MMLSFEDCKKIASEFVANRNAEQRAFWTRLDQLEDYIEIALTNWHDQSEHCYVFSYQSIEYLRTSDFKYSLAGNAPIIIDRRDGACIGTGTAHSVDYYLKNYEERGDPHKEKSTTVQLLGWKNGAEPVPAIKALRLYSNLGLADAKRNVDDCLTGKSPLIKAKDMDSAEKLVSILEKHHFSAKQI